MIRLDELRQGKDSSSDNSSVYSSYKHGQADGSSVKTNNLRSLSFQTCLRSSS